MTVNTTTITSGPYVGNDLLDTYAYTFRVDDESQLDVYETTDTLVQTLLVVDADYTVNNIGVDGGGTITRLAGNLPTDYQWYIKSNRAETQLTEFPSQGRFFPETHEKTFDHLTFLIQQLRDAITGRIFKLSDTIPLDGVFTITQNAANRVGKFLGFDMSGDLSLTDGPQLLSGDGIYDTVALMKATSPATGLTLETRGYYSAGDGGGARYLTVAPQGADGYVDHQLTNSNIAVLQYDSVIKAKRCGAKADGVSDNSVMLQSMISVIPATGGEIVYPPGSYYFNSAVSTIQQNISITGTGASGGSTTKGAVEFTTDQAIYILDFGISSATYHGGPTIKSITFRDTGGIGLGAIRIKRMNFHRIDDINVMDFIVGTALMLDGTGEFTSQYSYITNVKLRNTKNGIHGINAESMHIVGGQYNGSDISGGVGILLDTCNTCTIDTAIQDYNDACLRIIIGSNNMIRGRYEQVGASVGTGTAIDINGTSSADCQNNVINGASITGFLNAFNIGEFAVRTYIVNIGLASNTNDFVIHALAVTTSIISSRHPNIKVIANTGEGDATISSHYIADGGREYGLQSLTTGEGRIRNITGGINELRFDQLGGVRIPGNTSGKLGFYGTTPQIKLTVTGAKGGNAALTSLINKLTSLGIIADSTT